MTSNSTVITLHDRLIKKNGGYVINSSSLNDKWLNNIKDAKLDKIKFLYVGRINPEKGIYEFLKMFEKIKIEAELSIVGNLKKIKNTKNKNVKLIGYVTDNQSLIDIYDSNNIFVLPSFTEGQPHVVDESLARRRPVIVFEDIAHIIKERKGVFVAKRTVDSFCETTKYIIQNYAKIQENIEKNKFPLKKDMLKQISNIIGR